MQIKVPPLPGRLGGGPMSGLYIHIPFCASRCIYCDFYSTTGLKLQEQYVDALIRELQLTTSPGQGQCSTIYIGGGTPSTLSTALLDQLFAALPQGAEEFTMECNPDDITPEFAEWISSSRVNRVSMGAQTFCDDRLRWLNRRHRSQQVDQAVHLLRDAGIHNISLDLMFGFPDETLEQWTSDIDHALALHPEHLSAYSLMYEEGTPLYRMLERGDICEIDDELSLRMYDALVSRLTAAGYEHYEISNFALPGLRSRHNSSYWRQVPYLGIGAAAHSFDGTRRWYNIADVQEYIRSIRQGTLPREVEQIDRRTRYNDIVTTATRTREGICLADLNADERSYLVSQAQPHIAANRLVLTPTHLHLSRQGIYTSDDIMSDLIML